jgi:serine/threonine protein kinase
MPDVGQTISHYRIVEKIGEGGMGEVYLADDTTLDRKVALKFLPEAFTSDPERMARFEREAKLLASLNHPNIAGIHGLEQADGNRFLVLEYVEGETLQARLSKEALPLEDALALCRQIAEGLEAAHEKGVIHRDLKPANVMITAEEKVKILDFGLAKAFANEQSDLNLSNSPTLSLAATQQGVILGTAGYMSPEQARGKSVDKRTDIWAFGVILYEMLTGSQLFKGETVSDTMASVLTQEPEFDKVPIKVRPLLKRCLARDPKLRLRDIGDTMLLLEFTPEIESADHSAKGYRFAWGIAISAVLVAVALFILVLIEKPQKDAELRYFEINYPDQITPGPLGFFALSPDDSQLAFWGMDTTNNTMLWLHSLESGKSRKIPGTEVSNISTAGIIFWSFDGRFIAFCADNQLKYVNVSSFDILTRCNLAGAGYILGGSWNRDNVIIFGDSDSGSIMRISAMSSEKPQIVASPNQDIGEEGYSNPVFLPDQSKFLYSCESNNPEIQGIYVWDLDSKPEEQNRKRILETRSNFIYLHSENSGSSYLVTMQDQNIIARQFNPANLEALNPIQLEQGVGNYWGHGFFSATDDILVYRSEVRNQFEWRRRDGDLLEKVGDLGNYRTFDLSRDGSKLVAGKVESGNLQNLWVIDVLGKDPPMRLTFGDFQDTDPRWTINSDRVIFASDRDSHRSPFQVKIPRSDPELIHSFDVTEIGLDDVSPDDQYIIYHETGGSNLWRYKLSGEEEPEQITSFKTGQIDQAQFSPDGRWIAFNTSESGRDEIKVISFQKKGEPWSVSENGGIQPTWGKNGKELYFLLDGTLMVVDILAGETFRKGSIRSLFPTDIFSERDIEDYVPDPSGEKFLFLRPVEQNQGYSFNVILNWTSKLEQ